MFRFLNPEGRDGWREESRAAVQLILEGLARAAGSMKGTRSGLTLSEGLERGARALESAAVSEVLGNLSLALAQVFLGD